MVRSIFLASFLLLSFSLHAQKPTTTKGKAPSRIVPPTIKPDTNIFSESKMPILLDVRAEWCLTHRGMISIFQEIAFIFRKKIKCVKMLIESFEDSDETVAFLKKKFNVDIDQIPTFLFIKNGKVIAKIEEALSKQEFKIKVEKLLT